jgi:hypothetical protein
VFLENTYQKHCISSGYIENWTLKLFGDVRTSGQISKKHVKS